MSYNTEHYLTNGNKTFQESFNRVTQALLDGTLTGVSLKEPLLTKPYIERDSAANSPTGFVNSYGGAAYLSYLSAGGTKANPTPLTSGAIITSLYGAGYGTDGFDTASGYFALKTDENFGDATHRSAYWNLTVRGAGDNSVQDIAFFDKTTFTFGSTRGTGSIALKMGALTATTGTFSGAVSGVTSLSMSGALSGGTTATFSGDISSTGGKFGSNNIYNYIDCVLNGNTIAHARGSVGFDPNADNLHPNNYVFFMFANNSSNTFFKCEQNGKVTLTNPSATTSKIVSGVMATVTADKNIASSTTETTLIGTMAGINKTIGASHLTAGKTYRFKLTGYIGNTGTPTIRVKIKLGSTVILDSTAVTMVTITGSQMFKVEGEITCRTIGASGTVIGQADFQYYSTQTTVNRMSIVSTSAVTYDTTAIGAFDITAQWGTNSASNTITSTNFILEEIL